jgi:hypothetical protein
LFAKLYLVKLMLHVKILPMADTGSRFCLFLFEWSTTKREISLFEIWTYDGSEHESGSLLGFKHCIDLKFYNISIMFMNFMFVYGED